MFDDLADQSIQGHLLEFAAHGKGDQSLHGRVADQPDARRVTGDDLAPALAVGKNIVRNREDLFTGLQRLGGSIGTMLRLQHQTGQSRVLERGPDVGAGQSGQARVETLPPVPGRVGQGGREPHETTLRQGILERLLAGQHVGTWATTTL